MDEHSHVNELHDIDIHVNKCCENIVLNIYTFCIWLSALSFVVYSMILKV
jgi:hypothetical protein